MARAAWQYRTGDGGWFASARRQRRIMITPAGIYYLAVMLVVFGGAVIRQMNLLLVLGGMMAGPLLLSWPAAWRVLRRLSLRRRMPQRICAGDTLVVDVELANPRRRGSWAVAVEDRIVRLSDGPEEQEADTPIRPTVFFTYVPGNGARQQSYRGRLTRRGRYRLGPLQIESRFPFGLVFHQLVQPQSDTLVVCPRLGRLTRQWMRRHREAFEGSQRQQQLLGSTEADFFGVREWRSGDSARAIHWRTTARHGTLVVRQYEQTRNRDVAVLVDLWQPATPREDDLDNVELAVSFAATVVADLCRRGGGNVVLASSGKRLRVTGGAASAALLHDAMYQLALAEGSDDDGLTDLLLRGAEAASPGCEIVLISPRRIDLSDPFRFATLLADPVQRALLRRVRVITTAGDELDEYFEREE